MSIRSRIKFAKNVVPLLTDEAIRKVFDTIGAHRYMYPLLLPDVVALDANTVQRAVDILKTSGLVREQSNGDVSVYYLTMDGLHLRRDLRGTLAEVESPSQLSP